MTTQTRACFTHCSFSELAEAKVDAFFCSHEGEDAEVVRKSASHFDLFGSFAIAIDPLEARRIGVMPAMYFYSFPDIDDTGPEDLLRRLSETRQTLLALHMLEEIAGNVEIPFLHSPYEQERSSSKELGLVVDDENARKVLENTRRFRARKSLAGLQFDRRTYWQLVDKIEYLLGLFQNTDSTIEESPLAFFEQREWRLPYNSQVNTTWFSLGEHPKIRDPNYERFAEPRREILKIVQGTNGRKASLSELKATWVLNSVDGKPFSQLIRRIVCPEQCFKRTKALVDKSKRIGLLRNDTKLVTI